MTNSVNDIIYIKRILVYSVDSIDDWLSIEYIFAVRNHFVIVFFILIIILTSIVAVKSPF